MVSLLNIVAYHVLFLRMQDGVCASGSGEEG